MTDEAPPADSGTPVAPESPQRPRRPVGRPKRTKGEAREKAARAKLARYGADVESAMDDTVRLVEWSIEALRNSMTAGFAAKQRHVDPADIAALKALVAMLGDVVTAKKQFHAFSKDVGGGLTPAEVLEAAVQRIMKQDTAVRREIIKRLAADHNGRNTTPNQFPLEVQVEVARPRTALDEIAALAEGLE